MRVTLKTFIIKALLIMPLFLLSFAACFAQDSPEINHFKTEVNLIQVEVRVTEDGKPVSGLEAEDFQLKENGREQKISFLSYVEKPAKVVLEQQEPGPASGKQSEVNVDPSSPSRKPLSPVKNSPMDPSWIYLLPEVGDPFEFRKIAEAIREFIINEFQPGFYVSLGGLPYTDNKDLLLYTLGRLENKPYGPGSGISPELMQQQCLEDLRRMVHFENKDKRIEPIDDTLMPWYIPKDPIETPAYVARQIVFYGQLAIFRYMDLVERMALLPGRKSIVLFRSGLRMDRENIPLMDRLLAAAARNRVSFYTADARGLTDSSHDQPSGTMALAARGYRYRADPMYDSRRHQESEEGLIHLAENTGGQVVLNSNDMGGILTRVVDDSYSYYLLSYYPENISSQGKFRKLDISLRSKNDCKVSSVKGYYERKPVDRQSSNERLLSLKETMQTSLSEALRISAEPEVIADPEGNPLLCLSVAVPAEDFGVDKNSKKSVIEAELLLQVVNNYSLQMPLYTDSELKRTLTRKDFANREKPSLNYQTMLSLAPGYYQLKGIVRDKKTGIHGVYSSYVAVRDLKAESVPSSLILTKYAAQYNPEAKDNQVSRILAAGGYVYYPQADHEFRKGDSVYAVFHVYNATPEDFEWAARGAQVGLLKGNQPVKGLKIYGKPIPDREAGLIRYVLMFETSELEPGEYTFLAMLPNYPSRVEKQLDEQFFINP